MQFVCCALVIILASLEYISKCFYFRKLGNIAIIIYDRIIVEYIKWVFAEVHHARCANLITVLFVSCVFLVLLFVSIAFANHVFVKCFISFHCHSSYNLSFDFVFSNFPIISSLIHASVASVFAPIFNFLSSFEDFIISMLFLAI